ncbi:hypothetical protein [Halorarius litoreus]|uniref:hypothetical protein n=1 Tax=Halorarius litoreus TaxID=2962676 RepID=UPI0020CE5803|nr:hypothetical protein [Halorarius litoreus]
MVVAETVALVGVGLAAVLIVALLAVQRPPVTGLTVLAIAPWAVVAGLFDTLSVTGAYPATLAPVLRLPAGLLLAFVVAGLVWVPLLQLATLRDYGPGSGRYLAAAGLGMAVVLLVTLLVRQELDGAGLLWLSATPMLAAMLAALAYVLLGFVDPTTLATTRWVGYLVVFGFALLGTATAVGIDVYGQVGTSVTAALVSVARDLPTASTSVGWPAAVFGVLVGCLVATLVARAIRSDAVAGNALAIVVTGVTVGPAVTTLLVLVLR